MAVSGERKQRLEKNGITVPPSVDGTPGHTVQVKTQAPKTTYKIFVNKRKGTVEHVPVGIDPAFNWNVGKKGRNVEELKERIKAAKAELKVEPEITDGFVEAKTVQEAAEFAKKQIGIPLADYTGLDVRIANEWNREILNSIKEFPKLKEKMNFVGESYQRNGMIKNVLFGKFYDSSKSTLTSFYGNVSEEMIVKRVNTRIRKELYDRHLTIGERTMATAFFPNDYLKPYAGITINKKAGKLEKVLKTLRDNVGTKFNPEGGDTIKYLVDHEVGHMLDDLLQVSKDPDIIKLYKSLSHAEITNGLSEYAWNNDARDPVMEFVAEAWGEYRNNPHPRIIAKTVGELIERKYRGH
jgi:hypothetical protein